MIPLVLAHPLKDPLILSQSPSSSSSSLAPPTPGEASPSSSSSGGGSRESERGDGGDGGDGGGGGAGGDGAGGAAHGQKRKRDAIEIGDNATRKRTKSACECRNDFPHPSISVISSTLFSHTAHNTTQQRPLCHRARHPASRRQRNQVFWVGVICFGLFKRTVLASAASPRLEDTSKPYYDQRFATYLAGVANNVSTISELLPHSLSDASRCPQLLGRREVVRAITSLAARCEMLDLVLDESEEPPSHLWAAERLRQFKSAARSDDGLVVFASRDLDTRGVTRSDAGRLSAFADDQTKTLMFYICLSVSLFLPPWCVCVPSLHPSPSLPPSPSLSPHL
jgi:hypothetical protein